MSAAADAPTELELRRRGRQDDQTVAPVVDVVSRIDCLNSMKLSDTYRELGIAPPPPMVETARWEQVRYDMAPDGAVRSARRDLGGVVIYDLATTEPSSGAQEAIGKPGTIPKKLKDMRERVIGFVLPPRRSKRRYPRAVKIKMSNYAKKRPARKGKALK